MIVVMDVGASEQKLVLIDGEWIPVRRYTPPPLRRRRGSGGIYRRSSDGWWAGAVEFPPVRSTTRRRKVVVHKTFCGMLKKFSALEKPPGFEGALRAPRSMSYGGNRHQDMAAARAIATHTDAEWHTRCVLQCWRCYYCGEKRPLGKDHQIPVSRGGSDGIDNIVAACWPCNTRKGAKTAAEFTRRVQRSPRGNARPCTQCGHNKSAHLPPARSRPRKARCKWNQCRCSGYQLAMDTCV